VAMVRFHASIDDVSEFARFLEIGLGSFAPENIRIPGISNGRERFAADPK